MLNDRFWTKVDKANPSGCWIWMAHKNNKGYGQFRPGGTAPKVLAHRLSYEAFYGPIKKGQLILHSCDNPSCVNPAHLRAGTARENVADMDKRNRRKTTPMKGSLNANSLLSDAIVITARQMYVDGCSIDQIAKHFNFSHVCISDAVYGKSWVHVFDIPDCPTREQIKEQSKHNMKSASKLTESDVKAIKRRLQQGHLGKDIALDFGIHKATVSDIKRGKIWRDVTS